MIEQISHYRVEAELGRGGMGIVYRALDPKLGRAVAIKVLPPDATADPERHQRFVQEARSASALNHPNIVTIYEIGSDNGTTFIAMELVDGTPLDRLIAGAPMPVATALDYARAVGGGARGGARERNRASRHQAGEHRGHARRQGEGARLRAGEAGRAGRLGRNPHRARDPARRGDGHAGVHVAGAGAG